MEDKLLEAVRKHAEGHVAKHVANIEVYLNNPVGIGEHSDIISAIETELSSMAKWHEKLEMLDIYIMEAKDGCKCGR
tara:strand:- start:11070 stop:11300 length:231 start_codon:yes stop_codon:yes gene_type:complete